MFSRMLERISPVWEILFCPINFGQLYRLIYFHFCSKFWELNKSWCLERFSRNFFDQALEKFRQFQKFHLVQEIIKVGSFSILPKNFGTLEKSWRLKIPGIWRIFMLQIVLHPVHRLKKLWIYTQTFWALWENPNTWKKWGSFWDFFLPDNL